MERMVSCLQEDEMEKEKTFKNLLLTTKDAESLSFSCWRKIVTEFEEHLSESARRSLGYPVNLNCDDYIDISSLLRFHINNAGDPFHEGNFAPHSKKFETTVLDWFARLWGFQTDEYWGYLTNGGTEGNLQGILLGRELLPDGVLYTSRESHYSIFKAARMYRMKCVTLRTLHTGEIDYDDLREKLILNGDKPAIIIANIGTTFKGAVDNVDLVIETLNRCGFPNDRFYIHCDAALFGLIQPLLEQDSSCTFKKPIGSISVSAHKLLGVPMPCGVFMSRKRYIHVLANSVEYIASVDTTISGSRNGHAAVFIWYRLNVKGLNGIRNDLETCLKNARYLRDGLEKAGISVMLVEHSNSVVFERPLKQDFTDYWQLSYLGNLARVSVMPHVTTTMLDEFLNDLVQKRGAWYGSSDGLQPPCVAAEIGTSNCACSIKHGNGLLNKN